jgi:hypothetical protein
MESRAGRWGIGHGVAADALVGKSAISALSIVRPFKSGGDLE